MMCPLAHLVKRSADWDWLKRTIALEQMYFQQGRLILSKLLSVPRKVTPAHPGWIWFVKRPGLICLAARWSGSATSERVRPFWIIPFESVKVCWICFSSWKSFIGFYIWCYPISTILACSFDLFTVGIRISWKTLCWKESMDGCRDAISCLQPACVLYCVEREFDQIIMKSLKNNK